jgi:hypothetical protein
MRRRPDPWKPGAEATGIRAFGGVDAPFRRAQLRGHFRWAPHSHGLRRWASMPSAGGYFRRRSAAQPPRPIPTAPARLRPRSEAVGRRPAEKTTVQAAFCHLPGRGVDGTGFGITSASASDPGEPPESRSWKPSPAPSPVLREGRYTAGMVVRRPKTQLAPASRVTDSASKPYIPDRPALTALLPEPAPSAKDSRQHPIGF